MSSVESFAIDAMRAQGMSVSLDDDGSRAHIECREYADGTIDSGPVHELARQHDLDVERVLGDFDQGILVAIVVESADSTEVEA